LLVPLPLKHETPFSRNTRYDQFVVVRMRLA
jgi:hypothetical protein